MKFTASNFKFITNIQKNTRVQTFLSNIEIFIFFINYHLVGREVS